MALRRTIPRSVGMVAIAAALWLMFVPAALGSTGEPTLALTSLQSMIEASPSGSVHGYMKTVLRGSTIETIPVEVLALTGDSPYKSLILFRASGPKIDAIGGIASGMSGSPIYVEDGGVWKVIGAVSYGDFFTVGGTGLATPIEAMLQLIADYSPRTLSLSKPVLTSGGLVDRVIISAHPEKLSGASAAGAFVARPLSSIFIGGLRPGSGAYERLKAAFSARGISVTRTDSQLSAGASSFSTELLPGAAVAALAARGDMWLGGIGTVSYADGDTVLAYGHPAYWKGATALYMANAWIAGVWPSLNEPYKLGYPSVIKGTFTQDRYAGIMGELGAPPKEAPFTARVTNTDTGATGTSSVWISSRLLDEGALENVAGAAVSVAGYQVFDTDAIPGSASATTTVVVSDGADEYTVVIPNVFDDGSDVVVAMTEDADLAVSELLSVLADGLERPHIVSVDLQATVTNERRNARIVGVNILTPLHAGDNAVSVSLLAYGVAATQTIDATVTIPGDAALTGELVASCVNATNSGSDSGPASGSPDPDTPTRRSVAQVVKDLNGTPAYDTVFVEFVPGSGSDGGAPLSDVAAHAGDVSAIETSASTPWYLTGDATTIVTEISAAADPIVYGDDAYITVDVTGPNDPVEVHVYGVPAGGSSEVLLATGMAELVDGGLGFEIPVSGLTASTELRVAVDGGVGYTPAETLVNVDVRGRVRLSATPKSVWRGSWIMFTATVTPRAASGTVKFQYYDTHTKKWRTLITKTLSRTSSGARATAWWRPTVRGAVKVRVVYSGDADLGAANSSSMTIKVR